MKTFMKFCLTSALVLMMGLLSFGYAYSSSDSMVVNAGDELDYYSEDVSEVEPIRSSRYTIVRIHDPSRDKYFSNWYNNGIESGSTKKATSIYAAYYKVYQKNIGTGQMNYLYYEYHVTYHWYTRSLTSQPWSDHGVRSGTLRHQLTSIVDLLAPWT